jgi:hypothetical protein
MSSACRRIRHRPNPEPCPCGAIYGDMRTGMTYREVRQGMDPDRWIGRRRSSVLGYWRQVKLEMWDQLHSECIARSENENEESESQRDDR